MEKFLVSIIIPNYNYANYVRSAIDSALNQTYQNTEIIVIDDGSTDNSKEVLDSYGERIKTIFGENQGVSAARNAGIEQCAGDFVAFLDADDVWLPTKIEKQLERFEKEPALGLVHVGVMDIDSKGKRLVARLDGLEGDISHELLLFNRSVILGGGSGMMIPKKVLDEIGGFDTELSTSADWDLFYRIASRYNVGFINEILLQYRMHGANMHGNIKRMEREMLRGYEKAFEADGEKLEPIKRQAYGNLHKVLAGSYYHNGSYLMFIKHSLKSLFLKPTNIKYFLKYPKRKLDKRKK